MNLPELLEGRRDSFAALCQAHNVKTLYTFGSVITDRFDEKKSDLDFLVEIEESDPLERGEKLISFWNKLEDFFKRKVDLLTENSLKNPFLIKNIQATKKLIYDGTSQKIFS